MANEPHFLIIDGYSVEGREDLQAYLDEYSFRYNRWRGRECLFERVVSRVAHTWPITYKKRTDYQGWLARHRSGAGPPREGRSAPAG